ncbi:MAG: hypothetical protein WBB37_02870 [bacterium]
MLFLGQNLSVLVTQGLLAANLFVFQQGDTLKFLKGSDVIDQWLLFEDNQYLPHNGIVHTKKAKVSADSSHFFIHEEERHTLTDSILTKITFYSAAQEKLWEKSPDKGRIISYSLTNVYKNLVIMVTTNSGHSNPNLDIITNRAQTRVMKEDTWHRIIDYAISPNMQYLILHVKNPHHKKMWDYIFFIETDTHDTWTYLFPICVSCKRKRIELAVYDNGKSEVIYKGEHRVFSRQGKLIDIYREF